MALAIFLIVVYMLTNAATDAVYGIRGQQSPRMQARSRRWDRQNARRAADAAGGQPVDTTHRIRRALGGYIAGLVEDSAERAGVSSRRNATKRATKRTHNGPVGAVFDPDRRTWTVRCDRCEWTSREYATEREANSMRDIHAQSCADQQAGAKPIKPTDINARRKPA